MKKRILLGILIVAMVLSLAACGGGSEESGNSDSGESSDMKVSMITDSGDITDESLNQTIYEACKSWSSQNDVEFNYYKPESDSVEARSASIDKAIADGANVLVTPGYVFATSLVDKSKLYPDVKFVAIDITAGDICEAGVGEGYSGNPEDYNVADYYNADNVYCCTYHDELSGYMAGYAAVKLGYKKLGFLGGMAVPGVKRYGYGYVQGVDAAAKELDIADEVSIEFVYGGQFYGDADITAYMDTWYASKGVEVVFACGGGIYTSAAEAAEKAGGKVIGVDVDQGPVIDKIYGEGLTITSAIRGLAPTTTTILDAVKNDEWEEWAGKTDILGLISENADENYVGIPVESTQWGDGFTEDDFNGLLSDMLSGELTVNDDLSVMPTTEITVNDYGSIK